MRRAQRALATDTSWDLLRRAKTMELATTSADGHPILRTLNGVLVGDWILFHGAVAGEKNEGLGRPAVVGASETVAQIPSTFFDPEKACPATTYFRSVQAKGRLLLVEDEATKRAMLEALMVKLQPEGGYRSFLQSGDGQPGGDPDGQFYRKDLLSVRVIGVHIEEVSGKENLGQDRPPERTERVICGLWKRGYAGDMSAIETILQRSPAARPPFLSHDTGTFSVHPTPTLAAAHGRLLQDEYWRKGVEQEQIRASIENSGAWVGALSSDGTLLGAARAVTDGTWVGRICDVVVRSDKRGQGLGRKLVELLLDHPALRQTKSLSLGTRGQERFYEHFGFVHAFTDPVSQNAELRRRAPGA